MLQNWCTFFRYQLCAEPGRSLLLPVKRRDRNLRVPNISLESASDRLVLSVWKFILLPDLGNLGLCVHFPVLDNASSFTTRFYVVYTQICQKLSSRWKFTLSLSGLELWILYRDSRQSRTHWPCSTLNHTTRTEQRKRQTTTKISMILVARTVIMPVSSEMSAQSPSIEPDSSTWHRTRNACLVKYLKSP